MGRKNDCFRLILFFVLIIPQLKAQKPLEVFTKNINTVLLYTYTPGEPQAVKYKNSPIVNLKNKDMLIFEFDDLDARHKQYIAKIVHCNENGEASNLSEMQFLNGFNEYIINDYAVSQGPKKPYYHYAIAIPKPKISGAFVLQLFENRALLMQKRFYVYEPKIGLNVQVNLGQSASAWRTHQQLNIDFSLDNYFVNFPQEELVLKVIKNQDPFSIQTISNKNLRRSGANKWAYKNFEKEDQLNAGNEYRFIDVSDIYAKCQNVDFFDEDMFYSNVQRSREKRNYTQSFDQNGNFQCNTLDGFNPDLASAYYPIRFRLNIDKISEPVFINGKLCDWGKKMMVYNEETGYYEVDIFLKQGVYDFIFETENLNLEGDFSETHNTYELLMFQKTAGKNYTSLIGYSKIEN